MKKMFSPTYIKQIVYWFWRGRYHVLTFTAVIITILYLTGVVDYLPNIVSAGFSITGLLIILTQQLLDARQFADHSPNTIRSWILSFPTGKPIIISIGGSVHATSSIKARLTISLSPNATIENKVDFLLKQVGNIQDAIANVDNRIDDIDASLTKRSKELRTDLENIDKSIKTTVAGHIVGAYDINLFGIMITICGTLIQLFYSQTV